MEKTVVHGFVNRDSQVSTEGIDIVRDAQFTNIRRIIFYFVLIVGFPSTSMYNSNFNFHPISPLYERARLCFYCSVERIRPDLQLIAYHQHRLGGMRASN